MNSLINGCRVPHSRIIYWASPWSRAAAETPPTTSQFHEAESSSDIKLTSTELKVKNGILSLLPGPTQWTQVRFKEFPRFHRDLDFPNFDKYRKDQFKDVRKTSWGQGDDKVGMTYFIAFIGALGAMYGTKSEVTHFLSSMAAAADVRAMASIEVDVSKVAPGACISLKWRGKPLFVKHRTPAEIAHEAKTPLSDLKDPQTVDQRTPAKPEWLIVIGICTHLGCVPIPNSGDWMGGFYCPCHGSHYDNVGRARKGPAPTNLEVPPYKFLSDTLVNVG